MDPLVFKKFVDSKPNSLNFEFNGLSFSKLKKNSTIYSPPMMSSFYITMAMEKKRVAKGESVISIKLMFIMYYMPLIKPQSIINDPPKKKYANKSTWITDSSILENVSIDKFTDSTRLSSIY